MKSFIFLTLLLALAACDSLDYWKAIKDDPLNWVDRDLPREIVDGDQNVTLPTFNKDDPHFKAFNSQWKKKNFKIDHDRPLGRPWQDQDAPESFFKDGSYVKDLSKLPTSGKASQEPWSSTYWPIEYGILSVRYADNEKNSFYDDEGYSLTWNQSINKYSEPQDYQQAASGNITSYISDYFSPAEKYDLLVGDTQAFTLTNNNKQQGAQYEDENGDVESWMGICHGWSPAAISVPRPQNDVTLTAADGKTQVKFYADDIRGLASLKYAATNEDTLFAGGRCNLDASSVAKDPASGLVTDYSCFDINPGSWVIILANQLGINKKSLVIDATWDLQVWNQPMLSYTMNYFNILTDKQGDLESSKVKPSDIASRREAVLKFIHKMTSKHATHLVGVNMDIVYIAETSPSHNLPGADRKVKVSYTFTLELDDQNNILGGEWLHNKHPDFIWAPAPGAKPLNDEDNQIALNITGDISSPKVLQQLTSYAQSASQRGEVLGIVIDYLVAQSAQSAGSSPSLRASNDYIRLRDAYVKARQDYADFLAKDH